MNKGNEVVICNPFRTPVGRNGRAHKTLDAADLAAHVLRELVGRSCLPAELIEDVFSGVAIRAARPRPSAGRRWTLVSRSPSPGLQIDRRCGPGLLAIINWHT